MIQALEMYLLDVKASPALLLEALAQQRKLYDESDASWAPPNALVERLGEVASDHGGVVPFHSRAFALWLHEAFPNECPYPHRPSTTEPWLQEVGVPPEPA